MKAFTLLLLAVSVFAVSCERHDFEGPEGTKQLHIHHGAGHGEDAVGEHVEHGEAPAH